MTKDFSGQNLQGRSFKGDLALVGANFSNADIRGANFSNANLTGAKFVGATPAAVAGAIIITLSGGFLAYFVGWQALAIYSRNGFPWSNNVFVWKSAIAIAAWKGTRFDGANLTDVDFTNATLKHTDLRKARLTRTCFRGTRRLDYTQVEGTYLKDYQIRQLAVTPEGPHLETNFDRFDLRGINLSGANLQNVSFIGADLSQANLQDANLSGAKLVQTQLDRTNLTGAILTGACIEDWGLTAETQLDGIKCKYVFMRLPPDKKDNPSDDNPHRKPDTWNRDFEDGEFVDFIKPMVPTLDLYHNRIKDPRAIAIALNQLCEKYPEAGLEIISMEKKGRHQQGLLIRVNTHPQADRAQLDSEYFKTYDDLKGLQPQTLQHLLVEKDRQIKLLADVMKTMKNPGNIYAQNYYQGDTVMADNRHIHMGNNSEYREINTETYVERDYYNNPEQQKSLAEAAAEIQQLLEQLDKSNPAASASEKMVVAAEAVKQIEQNPKLLSRVMSAVKSGSLAALEASLEHPAASFVINALKDWKQDDR